MQQDSVKAYKEGLLGNKQLSRDSAAVGVKALSKSDIWVRLRGNILGIAMLSGI